MEIASGFDEMNGRDCNLHSLVAGDEPDPVIRAGLQSSAWCQLEA